MTREETEVEIVITKAILAALGAAILALADPTVQRYSLDTGQSQEMVQRHDLQALLEQRRALQNELCTLEARLSGSNVTHAVPAW